jgi:hypothetical protein
MEGGGVFAKARKDDVAELVGWEFEFAFAGGGCESLGEAVVAGREGKGETEAEAVVL